jgi:hypothetical protein
MKKASEDVITSEPDLTRWDTVRFYHSFLEGTELMVRSWEMVIVEKPVLLVLKLSLRRLIMDWEKMGMWSICSGN